MILVPAPEDFAAAKPLDPADLGHLAADRREGGERHVAVDGSDGRHYLSLTEVFPSRGLAVLLPLDRDFDVRLDAAARFHRYLRGRSAGPTAPALDLTIQRRTRLIQLLHALDFRLSGARPRAIAAALIDAEAARLPAVEWKSSALRRKANRLIGDAVALMRGGYRDLLRGG